MGRWAGLGLGLGMLALGLSGCVSGNRKYVTAGHVGCPANEITISDSTFDTWKAVCHGQAYMCSVAGLRPYSQQVSCAPMQSEYETPSWVRPVAGPQPQETASVTRVFNEKTQVSFVRGDFRFSDGELRVVGAPQLALGRVVFKATGSRLSEWGECESMDVLVNSRPTSATMGSFIKSENPQFSVEGALDFSVFKPLSSQYPEFSVRMCSETWKFTNEQVQELKKFLVMYSELAQEVQAAETPAATWQTF